MTSVLPNRLRTGVTAMPFGPLRRAARSFRLWICTAATPLLRHLTIMRSVRVASIAAWRNATLTAACDPAGANPQVISTQAASAAALVTNQLLQANDSIRPQGRPEFARGRLAPCRHVGGGREILADCAGHGGARGAEAKPLLQRSLA